MFNLITNNKSIKEIVKEEVFRQYVVGNLLSLCEAPINPSKLIYNPKGKKKGKYGFDDDEEDDDEKTGGVKMDADEIIKNFLLLPEQRKQELIQKTNEVFIRNISKYTAFVDFSLENHILDKQLFLPLALYSLGKKREYIKIKKFVYRLYMEFITNFYFKPTSTFIGTKSSFTGNKEVDKAIKKVIYLHFYKLLTSRYNFPKEFSILDAKVKGLIDNNSVFDEIKEELPELVNSEQNNEVQLNEEQLNEGFLTKIKLERLMFSINFLLRFNKKTNGLIREVMTNISASELKEISKGGSSNAASLITMAIVKRVSEELVALNITADKNIDKMLTVIAAYIAQDDADLNDKIENVIRNMLEKKLEKLKSGNTKGTNLLASLGSYAG
jgi:hypothetical protein